MAIYDEIQTRLRKQQQDVAAGSLVPVGTQAGLTAAARAGSGRATDSGTPRASNIGEQVAQGAAAAEGSQLANRIGAAADTLAGQTAAVNSNLAAGTAKLEAGQAGFEASQNANAASRAATRSAATTSLNTSLSGGEARSLAAATNQFQNKSADLTSEGTNATDDVFASFRQGSQELAFRKDAAKLEQIAFGMALNDRAYVDQLNQVGELRRLDDANNWSDEMQRLTLGDKLSSVLKDMDFKIDLNADQRAFDESMASMNADVALQILGAKVAGENAKQTIQGIQGLASTGGKIYNASSTAKSDVPATSSEPTSSNPVQSDTGYPVMEN